MPSYKKLGKDVLIMTIGTFGSKLLNIIFVPIYTAILTTQEYGIADLISTTTTLLFPFFSVIICEAMMRFALDQENDPAQVYAIGTKVTLLGNLALLVLSPLVLLTPLKEQYWFVLAYYMTYSLQQALSYFVRGIGRTKAFAFGGVVQTLVVVLSNVLFLVVLQWGVTGYLVSHVLGQAASLAYMFVAAKLYRYGFPLRKTDKALQRKMLAYSAPLIPNSASWWLSNAASRFFLTAFLGTAASGIFSVANKIPSIMTVFTGIFGSAWKINSTDGFGSEASRKFHEDAFSKLTCVMFLAVSAMLLVNKPIASILFQKDFYSAWQYSPLLLFSTCMHAFAEFYGAIYTAAYKTKYVVITTGMGAAVNIVLNYFLVPLFGIMGAAVSVAAAQTVIYLSRVIHSRSILKMKLRWRRDILCYILLLAQLLVATHSWPYEYLLSAALCLLMVLVLRRELLELLRLFTKGLRRRLPGNGQGDAV